MSGESFVSLHLQFRLGTTAIRCIVYDTCQELWDTLSVIEMPLPNVQQYKDIANKFQSVFQVPNCIGSCSGKFVQVRSSMELDAGSCFVLQGIVDADACFTVIDLADPPEDTNMIQFKNTFFGRALCENTLELPAPRKLGNSEVLMPYVFVGDQTFPLLENLMRPYSAGRKLDNKQRIFNFRFARAHRMVELAFGLVTSKFQCLTNNLISDPEKVKNIAKACCVLHNFIRRRRPNDLNEQSEFEITTLDNQTFNVSGRMNKKALVIQDLFSDYFVSSHGRIPKQEEQAHLHSMRRRDGKTKFF